jgi:fatty acid desaturase
MARNESSPREDDCIIASQRRRQSRRMLHNMMLVPRRTFAAASMPALTMMTLILLCAITIDQSHAFSTRHIPAAASFSQRSVSNTRLAVSVSTASSLTPSEDSSSSNHPNDQSTPPPSNKNKLKNTKNSLSKAALWHQQRRKEMIAKYGKEILDLEQRSSQYVGLPLLLLGNLTLLGLSLWSGSLPIPAVVGLAIFPGSIFSLWQLQILHDCLHGTLLDKKSTNNKQVWQERILFWGSLPCVFGYYLYLQYGHLSHHKSVGSDKATLQQLFDSSQVEFEDGDVLFVSHRMNLKGPIGPQIPLPTFGKNSQSKGDDDLENSPTRFPMSISRSGFHFWQSQQPIRNAVLFAMSFLFERYMLCWNDVVVAITGRNFFFPNKPEAFHRQCATYTRCAVALRLALFVVAGWKSLLFLYLSETLWSIPPHPACAMFITNHGSKGEADDACRPTASTYAGAWYSLLTLGTNYHCEHHDFPSIPFHLLGRLHQLAPEYYNSNKDGSKQTQQPDDVFRIMKDTFAEPDFYACSNANQLKEYSS